MRLICLSFSNLSISVSVITRYCLGFPHSLFVVYLFFLFPFLFISTVGSTIILPVRYIFNLVDASVVVVAATAAAAAMMN